MPPVITHADLDCAVDRFYRKQPFPHDRARVEHFFAFALAAPLARPKRSQQSSGC